MDYGDVTRLTDLRLDAFNPIVSPDGQNSAFSAGFSVYVMKIDGSDLRRLTLEHGEQGVASFSPDSSRLAYIDSSAWGDDNSFDICTIGVDGSDRRRLTCKGTDSEPVFSPDGRTIAFQSDRDGTNEIYLINADGSGVTRLTYSPVRESGSGWVVNMHPVFSPDGQWVFFSSSRPSEHGGHHFEIYRMRPDGSEIARLSYTKGNAGFVAVSPDGTRIAFTTYQSSEPGLVETAIQVMSTDGSGQTRLESSPGVKWIGSLSPDGRWIAFQSTGDRKSDDVRNTWDIYLISMDGEAFIRLTDNAVLDANPRFTPDGSGILFNSNRDGHGEIYRMRVSL